jgi:hypothetical protein
MGLRRWAAEYPVRVFSRQEAIVIDHAEPRDPVRGTDGAAEELAALEAQDPEGHGQDIRITPAGVAIGVACLVVVIAAAAGIAWAVSGGEAARLVAGGSVVLAVLLAVPFGGLMVLRSNTHRDLERKAERMREAPGGPVAQRPSRRWSRIRAFRRTEQRSTVEAKQRMDDDGGPVVGVPRVEDR